MKPKAFLSYRHNLDPEIAGKEVLIQAVEVDQKLELVFDKSVTKAGNSVTEFMEELIAARCVFVFITQDYFESAYTLFELVTTSEYGDTGENNNLDQKIIIPICLSEEMINIYDHTKVKAFWNDNEEVRDALGLLLSGSNRSTSLIPSSDQMWERLYRAWLKVIDPYLHELRSSKDACDYQTLIKRAVDKSLCNIDETIKRNAANDYQLIKKGIIAFFDKEPSFKIALAEQLERAHDFDSACLTDELLEMPGEDSIPFVVGASKNVRSSFGKDSQQWRQFFIEIQHISGFLLLNTIDSAWWFNHELELRRQAQQGITSQGFKLDHHAFVEVIISKELLASGSLKSPRFCLGTSGSKEVVIPGGSQADTDYNTVMFFDAINVNATAQQLLGGIYQDLVKSTAPAYDKDELISEIKYAAKSQMKSSGKRPVYYIVSEGYLNDLKGQKWFPEFQKELTGIMQFICWNQKTLSDSGPVTLEDQRQLLHDFRQLLNLNKD